MANSTEGQPKEPGVSQLVQSPPGLPPQGQAVVDQDAEHLKILSVCYYVMSGLSLIAALFCVLYIIVGGMMMSGGLVDTVHTPDHQAPDLRIMGGMFLVIGLVGALFIVVLAVLEFVVARKLVRRESKMLCMVVAGINCVNMPLGTVLGIFTFIVLSRPSVAASFSRNQAV